MPGSFRTQVRVRLSETDALGVVYYGQYLTYFDISRLELLRKAGITLQYLRRRKLGFVARESTCSYISSAKFDEVLTLKVRVSRIGTSSIVYSHKVERGKVKIAEGRITDVLVGDHGNPVGIPEDIRERLSRYSARPA